MRTSILMLPLLLSTGVAYAGWEEVDREAGIVVSEREVAGRSLPTFRGIGVIKGSVYEIMAILRDIPRRPEWSHKCIEARILESTGTFTRVIYNRTDAPWPVDDRDVVLKTSLRVVEKDRVFLAEFRGISSPLQRPVDGVVRMPYIKGYYRLERLGDRRTRVEYLVDADPGGWLPTWLARRATRDLPLKTLQNLRRQIRRTRGQYEDFLDTWDPSRARPATPTPTPTPTPAPAPAPTPTPAPAPSK